MGDLRGHFSKPASERQRPVPECRIVPAGTGGYGLQIKENGHVSEKTGVLRYDGISPRGRMQFSGQERGPDNTVIEREYGQVLVDRKSGQAVCVTDEHPKGIPVKGRVNYQEGMKPIEVLEQLHKTGQPERAPATKVSAAMSPTVEA